MQKVLSAIALALALAAVPAAAIPRPDIPSPAAVREPDLLTDYERGVLRRELAKLEREISSARREAAKAPEVEPLRAALEEAKLGGNPTNVAAKARALSDAVETVLYRDNPDIPDKARRLLEVGRLLAYDTSREKAKRATRPSGRAIPPAKPLPPAEEEDAPTAAPDGGTPAPDPPETAASVPAQSP